MMKHENRVAELVSSLIALVNSVILLVQEIQGIAAGDADAFRYCITALYFVISVVSLVLFVSFVLSFVRYKRRLFGIRKKKEIARYLIDFMENGGRTAILSRDLSWITDEFVGRFETMSGRGDLLIFIPHPNEVSERLRSKGADVRYFGSLLSDSADSIIKSRFTIIQWDSNSARITYPKEDHTHHYNFEYVIGDPAMDLAQDLIRLLIKLTPENQEDLARYLN